jgi:hypothetical protein
VGDDDPIFKAIRENPFSITKTIAKDRERSTAEAEDAFNKQNLFYGGARIKGLGDLEQSFLQRGTEAQSGIRGKLDEIEQALLQAEQESLGRQLDYLMTNPYGGGYGGSGDVGGYDEEPEPPPRRTAPPGFPEVPSTFSWEGQVPFNPVDYGRSLEELRGLFARGRGPFVR